MKKHLVFAPLLLALSWSVYAEDAEDGIIKYRELVMKSLGAHVGAMGIITQGKVTLQGQLANHARAVAALAGTLPSLFPKGSDFGETDALPAIWEEWETFQQAAKTFDDAALALSQAATGGEINGPFKDLTDSCKGCHKKFRENKDH